ncbi:ligand-dependent nuclear receptor-interacting factor 1 [Pseudophryne corroboree]|uniref:ligand-dependent nuclear receptor-interacting factor 1 n=1 Tax=Pseudophryne corroboree TaxID=495146 RepID=UPI003081A295
MSDHQQRVVTQTAPPLTCLKGCLYQVVQSTGPQGENVLNLFPILKSKDNLTPVVPSPVIPNASALNGPQAVRNSLPSPVSNIPVPSPAIAPPPPLLTQPAVGNYIITTPRNIGSNPKTIRVDSAFSTPQDAAVILEKSQPTLPPNSPPGSPTFLMMNRQSTPLSPTPMLPSGHRLQIPAHAEVRSVLASSLPLSIQQKILPQTGYTDITKSPSVIYVSPVNTVKTLVNQVYPLSPKPNASSIAPVTKPLPLIPAPAQTPLTGRMDSPKGPMKWIVQESRESASCLVPVTSSNDTASKILQMLSGTKTEEIKLTASDSSKVIQIKENALVMCNNKIFFLTKRGTELSDTDTKKPEPPAYTLPLSYASPMKPATDAASMKDLSNKVVEVVLSKNKTSPNSNPPSSPADETQAHPSVCTPVKSSKTSVPLPPNRNESTLLYVNRCDVTVKPRGTEYGLQNTSGSTKLLSADKLPQEYASLMRNDQVIAKAKMKRTTKTPSVTAVKRMYDESWRKKYGLVRKEKVILKRIPLLQAGNGARSKAPSAERDVKDYFGTRQKNINRKPAGTESVRAPKRKSVDSFTASSGYSSSLASANTTPSVFPSVAGKFSSPLFQTSSLGATESANPHGRTSPEPPLSHYSTETFTSPSDSLDFHVSQDITGHFSQVSLPSQRYHFESLSSGYVDETTKDEKIQRLKEVLKEREEALEALRRQKKI